MISTGNDIVALDDIDINRTRQQRFYAKFLLPQEVGLYKESDCPTLSFENFIWLLWSVKESVYKFCKRLSPQFVFSPGKIIIHSIQIPTISHSTSFGTREVATTSLIKEECFLCIISAGARTYYSRSMIYDEIIYTVVNDYDDFDSLCWGVKYIDSANPAYQSEEVRHFALQKFKTIYPNAELCFIKSRVGYPVLKVDEEEMKTPVSFTHHNRFVAYAFIHNF